LTGKRLKDRLGGGAGYTVRTDDLMAESFGDEWRPFDPPQQLYRFAEADDCSDDTAAPTVDRIQIGRTTETARYLARN